MIADLPALWIMLFVETSLRFDSKFQKIRMIGVFLPTAASDIP
jgi:hypothetical protein